MMQINEKIRQARVSKGWSQQQIAEKLEESRSSYAEWEKETIPRADILVKISAVTGVSIIEFIKAIDKNAAGQSLNDEKTSTTENVLVAEKPSADFLAGKLASKDETIQQIEARRRDAVETANKMEEHYNDMKSALERAQITINEVLKPIKEQTAEILSNSKKAQEGLRSLKTEIVAEHGEMMETLDQIAGNPAGTTAAKAGILELAHRVHKTNKGKKANTGKRD